MDLPVLTPSQFDLIYNGFSLAIAAMGAGFLYFILARGQVAPAYRTALTVSALVVAIAFYHYLRIFDSWAAAFVLEGGVYIASGKPFNDAYRYVDWLLTVPLLLTEAVLVLRLKQGAGGMIARLSLAAVLMIVTGYPGEVSSDTATRLIWGTISTIPFLYILYILWVELGKSLATQPARVQVLVRNLRLLLLATWGVYPIAYLAPIFGFDGAGAVVALQTGYTVADILAKPFFGALIVWIAIEKSRADGWTPDRAS
jgi:bacteriorhodopsin